MEPAQQDTPTQRNEELDVCDSSLPDEGKDEFIGLEASVPTAPFAAGIESNQNSASSAKDGLGTHDSPHSDHDTEALPASTRNDDEVEDYEQGFPTQTLPYPATTTTSTKGRTASSNTSICESIGRSMSTASVSMAPEYDDGCAIEESATPIIDDSTRAHVLRYLVIFGTFGSIIALHYLTK